MKAVVLSDTLGHLPKIDGKFDLLIHAGNFAPLIGNEPKEIEINRQADWMEDLFCPWFKSIQAEYKILTPGENDHVAKWFSRDLERHIEGLYLQGEAATIKGMVFYGMPWLHPEAEKYVAGVSDPSFLSPTRKHFQAACRKIPDRTNILITRLPPKGILDGYGPVKIGDFNLMERVDELKELKMHIFGLANNNAASSITRGNVVFVNAHMLENNGKFSVLNIDF